MGCSPPICAADTTYQLRPLGSSLCYAVLGTKCEAALYCGGVVKVWSWLSGVLCGPKKVP